MVTDEQLMARLQGGDRDAYRELYQRHRQRIFNFLIRRTGARHLAEEALQDTWLRVYRSCHRFDTKRRFSTWLFTLASRAGHDAREPASEELLFEQRHDDRPDLRDLVVKALHGLAPTERRIVLLSSEGFSSVEIADMLDMKPSAVRMRLLRARKDMRVTLGET